MRLLHKAFTQSRSLFIWLLWHQITCLKSKKTVLDHVICMTIAIRFVIYLIVLNSPSRSPVNPNFFIITQSHQYRRRKNKTFGYFTMRKVKTFLFFDTVRGDKDLISTPMDQKRLHDIQSFY